MIRFVVLIWLIIISILVIFLERNTGSIAYIQEITKLQTSEDFLTLNTNFRNLNLQKKDRNFTVYTSTPTTSDITCQTIELGSKGTAKIIFRVGDTLYYIEGKSL